MGEGKSVQEMVNEALRRVPNTDGNKNIDMVNQIRNSLAIMGVNSTAFSLPQDCTREDSIWERVCFLPGADTGSLEQRRDSINRLSCGEVFNKGILEKCLKLYSEKMETLELPLPEVSLQEAHDRCRDEIMQVFDQQNFGRHHAKKSITQLDEEILKVYKNVIMQNEYQSSKLCEGLYTRCEDIMDQLQVLRLPSMAKFNAGFQQCNHSFELECVGLGPSKTNYDEDVGEVSVTIYKGVQPQAFQLVGGLLPGHGSDWTLYYKVHFD